ncbi:hypothetical protein PROFUN_13849 [Planoprotostelium fungivorum]|uniref:Uncharacterized protein n=1 Tax=Planoprotostelium fungivorum TaxID=1890364 RepID=A0A2P6N2Q0_9EUKA|nr:hypothetical protein PROFUN_13849 [Planoprotostelium fungivorum]
MKALDQLRKKAQIQESLGKFASSFEDLRNRLSSSDLNNASQASLPFNPALEHPATESFEVAFQDATFIQQIVQYHGRVRGNIEDANGYTLIQATAAYNREDILQAIKASCSADQFDVDHPDKNGWTALHIACYMNHLLVAGTLIGFGADPQKKNVDGNSPVRLPVKENSETDGPLSGLDVLYILKMMKDKNVDWNVTNDRQETPLHSACLGGSSLDVISFLIRQGADAEAENRNGDKPMIFASRRDAEWAQGVLQTITEQREWLKHNTFSGTTEAPPPSAVFPPIQNESMMGGSDHDDDSDPAEPSTVTSPVMDRESSEGSTRQPSLAPVILVPGLCSSALEVWESPWNKKGDMSWHRSRLWISVGKLGKQRKRWLKHYMLEDGWRDPPRELTEVDIKVRPVEGLHGIDFLSQDMLVKDATVVFSSLISHLSTIGYDSRSLYAATYDWRIPPSKLEERDGFFTKMMGMIEIAIKINGGRKALIIAHSMGNRLTHYFFNWVEKNYGKEWIDRNIETYFAVGAPWLGSPKTVRGTVVGEKFGLDLFLNDEEGSMICRNTGSMPWLFPLRTDLLKYGEIAHMRRKQNTPDPAQTTIRTELEMYQHYEPIPLMVACKLSGASNTWTNFEKHYKTDDLFWGPNATNPQAESKEGDERATGMKVLEMPSVKHIVCIHGINLKTEVTYFFKRDKKGVFQLDSEVNMELDGLTVKGGIGYETSSTTQSMSRFGGKASGDGTVPYISLNYPQFWMESNKNKDVSIEMHEIQGAEHRNILQNKEFFAILDRYLLRERQTEGAFSCFPREEEPVSTERARDTLQLVLSSDRHSGGIQFGC